MDTAAMGRNQARLRDAVMAYPKKAVTGVQFMVERSPWIKAVNPGNRLCSFPPCRYRKLKWLDLVINAGAPAGDEGACRGWRENAPAMQTQRIAGCKRRSGLAFPPV